MREVPLNAVVHSPLLKIILDALSADEPFEPAVQCICALLTETRDVDETILVIQTLYPHVIGLKPKIAETASAEDFEKYKGISRIFAEAGEAWVLLIARMPCEFRALVDGILECAALDQERDAISHTFRFWYELKQYLTLDKYMEARMQYYDVYSRLVDIMISHLEYPKPENGDENDLFNGDRTQEEHFRDFRHMMGDVLKDCCDVIGVTDCLQKSFKLIDAWVHTYGPRAGPNHVPEWQKLEAPLFSLRAMGEMIPVNENIMLPRLVPLLVAIPNQEKLRYQAIMALGRYTEWTAHHPETLQVQLDFIMQAFDHPSRDVVGAGALSFKFFCSDCRDHLVGYTAQLQEFYARYLDKLSNEGQEEITKGVASVLARIPPDQTFEKLKLFCDPVVQSLVQMAQQASDKEAQLKLAGEQRSGDVYASQLTSMADRVQILTIFIQRVQPAVGPSQPNPAVAYCQTIFPVLATIAERFMQTTPVLERICRCWRHMVLSYRTAALPLLPQLAEKLAAGFTSSRQGCFLWATDSIVREFSEGVDGIDASIATDIFRFYEQQTRTFLSVLNDLPPENIPDCK